MLNLSFKRRRKAGDGLDLFNNFCQVDGKNLEIMISKLHVWILNDVYKFNLDISTLMEHLLSYEMVNVLFQLKLPHDEYDYLSNRWTIESKTDNNKLKRTVN